MAIRLNPIDNPLLLNASLAFIVTVQAVATSFNWIPNMWEAVKEQPMTHLQPIFLALVGVAAMLAALAGVLIVFVLQDKTPEIRHLRVVGERELSSNWTWIIVGGLLAAGIALVAALVAFLSAMFALWLFEFACLMLVHTAIRCLFLLRGVIDVVGANDIKLEREARKRSSRDIPAIKKRRQGNSD